MAIEYKLKYTGAEIDEKLEQVGTNKANITQLNEDIGNIGGTVEVTSGEPTKENTVVTISPSSETTNIYTAEEVDAKFEQMSEEIVDNQKKIDDIGQIKTVTGTSTTVKDAIEGRIISCVGNSAVTVSGYNLSSVKELSCVGFGQATFRETKLPAGTYTLTAKCVTDNPNITNIKVSLGGFFKNLTCDGQRRSATFTITREVGAYINVWASDATSPITEYSLTLSEIVITADSSSREYEPYFKPITYDVDNLNEIKLSEYTNIITSDSEFTLRYIYKNSYVEALFSSIDVGTKMYVTPEDFGAYGNGLADDTKAVNDCIAYAIAKNMPIRGYGKYKTTDTINIIGDYVDLHIYKIDYLGTDEAVLYQGSNSSINIQSINSKGYGFCAIAETANVYYNTFNINEIISEKDGVYTRAKKNNYQNKLNFNLIRSKGDYSCIFFAKEENPDPGYRTEWHIRGGLVTGGLWGIRGGLSLSSSIFVHAEGLGSEGNGGAIFSESGEIPRIYYCRNAEVANINTFLKLKGVFAKPQIAEVCKTVAPLESIDITEVELNVDNEIESDNIQFYTEIEVQSSRRSNILLTKNLILWGNRFQFPPVRYIRLNVDNDIDMTPQYYNKAIPQCFVAKADATINLHPTYAVNCLNTFEIVQEEGHKLTLKDFAGNVIFDGTQYADGRYRLTAYVENNYALKYDMSNQLWEILEL